MTRVSIARVFLIRRTLRIFPAYYFYLVLLILLPLSGQYIRDHAGMYFLYLSNFQIYLDQSWGNLTPHLWTLAVEEQFYLLWPWLILFTPDKHLRKVFCWIVVAGFSFRLFFSVFHPGAATETVPMVILTPACIDAFAFGALLAYQHSIGKECGPLLKKIFGFSLPVWIGLSLLHFPAISSGFDRIFVAVFSMIIIEGAGKGYKNIAGRFLENRVVLYLGKISYGIYLYHLVIPFAFWIVFDKISLYVLHARGIRLDGLAKTMAMPWVSALIYLPLTILAATASWFLLEQPISKLKRLFGYSVHKTGTATPPLPLKH
jgi:peptidoglycan/LPS O-acetylase OafA/YrhL